MESSHHVNWNSIIYRKGALHRTEIDKPFLNAKGFDINLAQYQFLLSNHFIIYYVRVILLYIMCAVSCAQFPISTGMHLKQFCLHRILCTKNYNFWRAILLNHFKNALLLRCWYFLTYIWLLLPTKNRHFLLYSPSMEHDLFWSRSFF